MKVVRSSLDTVSPGQSGEQSGAQMALKSVPGSIAQPLSESAYEPTYGSAESVYEPGYESVYESIEQSIGEAAYEPIYFQLTARRRPIEKVAFYLDSLQGYGADRTLIRIANGLANKGLHVDFVLAEPTNYASQDIHPTIRLYDLASSRMNVLKNVIGLAQYLRVCQPDLLFSSIHFNNVNVALALALSGVKSKLVVRQANTLRHHLKSYPLPLAIALKYLTQLAYRRADLVISQSEGMSRDLIDFMKAAPEKIKLIYNPTVTAEIFQQAQQPTGHPWFDQRAAPIVLAAGRLKPQKDFPLLLRAFAEVRRSHPRARLVILGEGPQRRSLETLAWQLGIADAVNFPGFQKNPYAFIAMADVFVLSSRYEGLPNILIEALALGKRIVATDCESGPAEILKQGKYGRLIPVGDLDRLTTAIQAALDEPYACLRDPDAIADFNHASQVEKYIDAFCYHLQLEQSHANTGIGSVQTVNG